jgi:hypothetical protein
MMPRYQKGAMSPALGRGRGNGADHDWTDPTPTSERREAQEQARRRVMAAPEARRPAGDAGPRPATARREPTAAELERAAERSRAGLVRDPARRSSAEVITHQADQNGAGCECGPSGQCALHRTLRRRPA